MLLMHLQNLFWKIIIIHVNLENCLKQLGANNAPDKKKKKGLTVTSSYIFPFHNKFWNTWGSE